MKDLFSLNNKLELKKVGSKTGFFLKSKVIDYGEPGFLKIMLPMVQKKLVKMNPGEKYDCYMYTEEGLYVATVLVERLEKEDHLYLAKVKLLSEFQKSQRRDYYRLEYMMEMQYHVEKKEIKQDEIEDFMEEKEKCETYLEYMREDWIPAVVTNISGGGLKYTSKERQKQGEQIRIRLGAGEPFFNGELLLIGKIIESQEVENKHGLYEHRVQFLFMRDSEREKIVQFIFEKERELRRKKGR